MIVTKKVEGEVDYNDGEFAEVETFGTDGIENGLWLGTMQIHRAKMEYSPDEFLESYLVGMLLQIVTTTEIRPVSQSPLNLSKYLSGGPKQ